MTEHSMQLHGSWRLVSFETELQDSKVRTQPWGANPKGRLVFGADGRMTALLTAQGREPGQSDEKLLALFRTAMAYTGQYRVEGDKFITLVDASLHEVWNGTEQERLYALDGDMLEVFTAWMPNPMVPGSPRGRAVLGFRRE